MIYIDTNKPYKIYGEIIEKEALDQFRETMNHPSTVQGALMPDAHTGYTLPIGCVWKTKGKIFPAAVGYDIGCGMSAIRTSVNTFTTEDLELLKSKIMSFIPLGRDTHKYKQKLPNYNGISEIAKNAFKDIAPFQLGTLGSGNHFIEIGKDREGFLNIVIHSGSRNVGHKIAEHYMKLAAMEDVDKERYEKEFEEKNNWKDINPEGYEKAKEEFVYRRTRARLNTNIEGHYGFDINSKYGKEYLNDLNEALQFALDNREAMINNILKCMNFVFGKLETSRFINRNHNHAEIQEILFSDGSGNFIPEQYVIHRKGATHAEEGMLGVIPGNMKDGSFIVKGKGNLNSMSSSSHGAGRVLSRSKAKATLSTEDFHKDMKGIVTNHTDDTIDEAPKAYKNIFEVMELQKDLVEVIDHIKPLINIKG